MTTTDIIAVNNLRGIGCEELIKSTLKKMAGVEKVFINEEKSEVNIIHDQTITRNMLVRALQAIGYPENDMSGRLVV